jgi:hypothetical protein
MNVQAGDPASSLSCLPTPPAAIGGAGGTGLLQEIAFDWT